MRFDLERFTGAVATTRARKKLDHRQMAVEIGVSPSTAGRLLAGKHTPGADIFFAVCGWMERSPADFGLAESRVEL